MGDLGRLLSSNGYEFDLVNDDALQRRSSLNGQALNVGRMTYRALIVPNISAMPLESLRRVEAYASHGGIVIALERVPEASCGMQNWQAGDREVSETAARLFERLPDRTGWASMRMVAVRPIGSTMSSIVATSSTGVAVPWTRFSRYSAIT